MHENENHWLSGWRRCTAFAVLLVSSLMLFAIAGSGAVNQVASQETAAASPPVQDQVPLIDVDEIDRLDGSPLTWFEDYEAARKIARLTKKPMFVVIRCER